MYITAYMYPSAHLEGSYYESKPLLPLSAETRMGG